MKYTTSSKAGSNVGGSVKFGKTEKRRNGTLSEGFEDAQEGVGRSQTDSDKHHESVVRATWHPPGVLGNTWFEGREQQSKYA